MDELKKKIRESKGNIAQVGCADKNIHTTLYNSCKRNQRLLITYTMNETDKINAGITFGTYHLIREWTSEVDLSRFELVIKNQ